MAYGATKYDVWNAIFSGAEKAGGLFGMKQKAKQEESDFATSLALDYVTKIGNIEDPAQAATMKDIYTGIFQTKYPGKKLDFNSIYGGENKDIAGYAIKKMSIPQITAMVEGAMGGYGTEKEKALAIQRIAAAGNVTASKAVFDAMVVGGKESIRAAENAQKRADKLAEKENKKNEILEVSDSDKGTWQKILTTDDPVQRATLAYSFGLTRAQNQNKVKQGRAKGYVSLFNALDTGAIRLPNDVEQARAIIQQEIAKRMPGLTEFDAEVVTQTALDAMPFIQKKLKEKNKVPFFKKVSSLFSADAAYAKEGKTPSGKTPAKRPPLSQFIK